MCVRVGMKNGSRADVTINKRKWQRVRENGFVLPRKTSLEDGRRRRESLIEKVVWKTDAKKQEIA